MCVQHFMIICLKTYKTKYGMYDLTFVLIVCAAKSKFNFHLYNFPNIIMSYKCISKCQSYINQLSLDNVCHTSENINITHKHIRKRKHNHSKGLALKPKP